MNDIGPGDIVICVDVRGLRPEVVPLTKGARYVVRQVFRKTRQYPSLKPGNGGVRLRGITNLPPEDYPIEPVYCLFRFRPINESDSEIFREMIKHPERETV